MLPGVPVWHSNHCVDKYPLPPACNTISPIQDLPCCLLCICRQLSSAINMPHCLTLSECIEQGTLLLALGWRGKGAGTALSRPPSRRPC